MRYLSQGMARSKDKSLKTAIFELSLTMYRIEVAVKQILCGLNVKTSASVANAECLDWYRDWAAAH